MGKKKTAKQLDEEIKAYASSPAGAAVAKHRMLVVEYDVAKLDNDEIGNLKHAALAQADGGDGYPPVRALTGTSPVGVAKPRLLAAEYDVSSLSDGEIENLKYAALAQADGQDGHPADEGGDYYPPVKAQAAVKARGW